MWVAMREYYKSDTATDRAWQATELGKEETKTKLKLKALEKEMSAIKTHLKVKSDEARNMY